MALALILIGIVLWLTAIAPVLGIALVIIGIILLFVPGVPYGVRRG